MRDVDESQPSSTKGESLRSLSVRLNSLISWPFGYQSAMRGDRVQIVVDAGEGGVRTYDIIATRNGRRVEIETGRGFVTVSEVTRSGTPVRSGRFLASRVIALVEHPAADENIAQTVVQPRAVPTSA